MSSEIKAYIYSRYSSGKQRDGDSERRQHANCYEFATEKLGVPIDETLRDHGVSGFSGINRIEGALGSFIRDVEGGRIAPGSFLIVDSMDRVSREEETQVLNLLTGLSLKGIRFVDVAEGHVLPPKPDSIDWIRLLLQAARSHGESVEKSRKMREHHANAKQLAREGVIWHSTGPGWLKCVRTGKGKDLVRSWQPIPERVETVRRIYGLAEAGMGSGKIANRLNDERVPTFGRSRDWHGSVVLDILRNRSVLGEYQPRFKTKNHRQDGHPPDGEPIVNYYGNAIVDIIQFTRVQAILDRSGTRRGKRNSKDEVLNLFQGVTKCGRCGGTVGLHYSRTGARGVLVCLAAQRGARVMDGEKCTNRTRYRYEPLEASILRHLPGWKLEATSHRQHDLDALAIATTHRDQIATKVANLLDLIEDGGGAMMARYRERSAELESANAKIAELKSKLAGRDDRQPSDHQKIVSDLVERMLQPGAERNALRAQLRVSLQVVIDLIEFDWLAPDIFQTGRPERRGGIRVVGLGGALSYVSDAQSDEPMVFSFVRADRPLLSKWIDGDVRREEALELLRSKRR